MSQLPPTKRLMRTLLTSGTVRLRVAAMAVASGALLACAAASAAQASGSTVQDLHYGEVLFQFYQEDYFTAITHLLAARQAGRLSHHGEDSELLLGGMNLSYGMHEQAGQIFNRLLQRHGPAQTRDRAWYYLGKISYQRGRPDRAEEALRRVDAEADEALLAERDLLLAQVLMQGQRNGEAATLLEDWKGPKAWRPYAEFNYGVALIRAGDRDRGIRHLRKLGGMKTRNGEQDAIRDKSNLSLGYSLLKAGEAGQAREQFLRVRLEGPYSDAALLGAGWAAAEQEEFRRALVPWGELVKRDPSSQAVQEALIALPYAWARLDAHGRAAMNYERAIETYVAEIRRLDDAIEAISQGAFAHRISGVNDDSVIGWFWHLEEMPRVPQNRYLVQMMADHTFQEAFKNYRDLAFLKRNLDRWQDAMAAFHDMLRTRKTRYERNRPAAEKALGLGDLSELRNRREALATRLEQVALDEDALALATDGEAAQLARLEALRGRIDALGGTPDRNALLARQRLLYGALRWRLEEGYADRLWQVRKQLRQLDKALDQADQRFGSLLRAVLDSPGGFEGFSTRIDNLQTRLDELQPAVDRTLATSGDYLESLAIAELGRRRTLLEGYAARARIALAQSYDLASLENP